MTRYRVLRDCGWKDFHARAGQEVEAADLKTGDGKPLPEAVVSHLVAIGDIRPVEPAAPDAPKE